MSITSFDKKPIIAITSNFGDKGCELAQVYYDSVLQAGGIPIVIPPYNDSDTLRQTFAMIGGIILSGGGDISPHILGEEPSLTLRDVYPPRDEMEMTIVREAYNRHIPILGICRGMQVITAALGGTLYQDLETQYTDAPFVEHNQKTERCKASHKISIAKGSLLEYVYGKNGGTMAVNSFHHQAVKDPGSHLCVSAWAKDGVIEAVESNEFKSILGVQWHPECLSTPNGNGIRPLFDWLTNEALLYIEAKRLHRKILTIDLHCDTPMHFENGYKPEMFGQRTDGVLVDLPKMTDGELDAAVMAAYLKQGPRDEKSLMAATLKADKIISGIEGIVEANSDKVALARTVKDLYDIKNNGKKSIMIGIENAYAIGRDIRLVEHFRRRGVTYMTLCHNGDNDVCGSACGEGVHRGVTEFGADVIREMNRVGMVVDLSHTSENSFYDALDISERPVICSHSCARSLCDHPRNLTDHQIRALAEHDGVVMVTFYSGFLRSAGEATILDALNHIDHIVSIIGTSNIGIGTDFDGDGGVPGMASAADSINFTRHLMARRYTDREIRRMWGRAFAHVLKSVQKNVKGPEEGSKTLPDDIHIDI